MISGCSWRFALVVRRTPSLVCPSAKLWTLKMYANPAHRSMNIIPIQKKPVGGIEFLLCLASIWPIEEVDISLHWDRPLHDSQ